MKIYVGLISSTAELIKEFNNKKEALIPRSIINRLPKSCNFKFDVFDPQKSTSQFDVDRHVLESSRGYDYAACLIELGHMRLCENIRLAILSSVFDLNGEQKENPQNFFTTRLNKLFKSALFTIDKMKVAETEQAMRLPRRNFRAQELVNLCKIYRDDVLAENFHDDAKKLIAALEKKRRPRRRSDYPTKYFIDDSKKYFIFGKEIHAILPTGGAHQAHCELNGNFRFGQKISIDHHFNVSEGDGDRTYISGKYENCHNEVVSPEKGRTHLNMFTNDHF
jgi:hypothetical protein